MKKMNYIKMSFMGATDFLPRRIKLENENGKFIFGIPYHWNTTEQPFLGNIQILFIMNNIDYSNFIKMKDDEYIFIVEGDSVDLKSIDII